MDLSGIGLNCKKHPKKQRSRTFNNTKILLRSLAITEPITIRGLDSKGVEEINKKKYGQASAK